MQFFHIGYHKTATTWLQNAIYPHLEEINFVGRFNPIQLKQKGLPDKTRFIDELSLVDNWDFESVQARYEALKDARRPTLLSHENILRPYKMERTALRLKQLADQQEAKIIITIRKQDRLVFSRYSHDVNTGIFPDYLPHQAILDRGGDCRYPSCFRQKEEAQCSCLKAQCKSIPLWFYNFLEIYHLYSSIFSEEKVHVMPMEQLVDPTGDGIRDLLHILEIDPKAYDVDNLSNQDKLNSQQVSRPIEERKKEFFNAENGLAHSIRSYFNDSNWSLSERLDLHLEKWGYFQPIAVQQ